MNEFETKKHNESEPQVDQPQIDRAETEKPEVLDPVVEFESEPEREESSTAEVRVPKERTIVADGSISKILEENLDLVDPDREVGLVFIEVIDSEVGQRSKCRGLDLVLEMAPNGEPLIITGWQSELSYASDPRWHAVMAYPNVTFKRLPFSLAELGGIVDEAKNGEKRPFDPLALRMIEINQATSEIGSLEHILDRAIEAGGDMMKDWEARARKIFGDEMPLEVIIEKVRKKSAESLIGQMEGEEFPDLCFDIEGTLIQNGEINKDLLQKMIEESKTRPITIWTGGDIKQYEPILRKAGVKYKIASKYWFKGATVSESFDDEPEEEFVRKYGAKVEKYNQIG